MINDGSPEPEHSDFQKLRMRMPKVMSNGFQMKITWVTRFLNFEKIYNTSLHHKIDT